MRSGKPESSVATWAAEMGRPAKGRHLLFRMAVRSLSREELERESRSDRHQNGPEVFGPDFRALFESSLGPYLVLTPDLRIVTATETCLGATMTTWEGILGRYLFEVFRTQSRGPLGFVKDFV